MPPPSDMQDVFAAAVMHAETPVPRGLTAHTGARPKKRFDVYRNNIYAGLVAVLEGRFPVIARLLGSEFFAGVARAFIAAHPPRSPVLMEYGETFPRFLESFDPVADLPYLEAVARIEWAWNVAYYAADAEPVDLEELKVVPPAQVPGLTVTLHPSLSVVRSEYPAVTIWTANSGDAVPGPIDAGAGGEDAMILRPHAHVEVRDLPAGGAVFIFALQEGRTLGDAAENAIEAAAGFDLQANLAGLLASGAIAAVHRPASHIEPGQGRNG